MAGQNRGRLPWKYGSVHIMLLFEYPRKISKTIRMGKFLMPPPFSSLFDWYLSCLSRRPFYIMPSCLFFFVHTWSFYSTEPTAMKLEAAYQFGEHYKLRFSISRDKPLELVDPDNNGIFQHEASDYFLLFDYQPVADSFHPLQISSSFFCVFCRRHW